MLRRRATTLQSLGGKRLAVLVAICLWGLACGSTRIFVARNIVTMDPQRPVARAVAVRDGRIAAVGSLAEVRAALDPDSYEIDQRFSDKVLMPGLIDNHLHPSMAALLLPMRFATPFDWSLPDREVRGIREPAAWRARLRELESETPAGEWLYVWGYHGLFHGPLSRADLDTLSSTRPIVVWHRSFHEIFLNSAALRALELDEAAVGEHPQVDFAQGHFYETGVEVAFARLAPRLLSPGRVLGGLALTRESIHRGGITTIADMAFGLFDPDAELTAYRMMLGGKAVPFRTLLVPDGRRPLAGGPEAARAELADWAKQGDGKVRFLPQVKLFADGAFYSQLMQLGPPGYLDGHHGEWLMEPAELEKAARFYWDAGQQIHVHVNGDRGVEVTLDVLEELLAESPRDDHRFTLHHYGYSTDAQSQRAAALGAFVSANPYYVYALSDAYTRVGLGAERAHRMVRLGSLARAGVPISLHSDFTMAPSQPLLLAWVAANRINAAGDQVGAEERLDRELALRAVTLEAARAIRMEAEIGSIEVGKRADFTVLDDDPLEVPVEELDGLGIWGTVFEGRVFPIDR